ncbi:MAG TPA: DUF5049 domain-containing protein [Sphaerochaeta sp.]|nr:DUF5049 domain-containing protein [Sphaerochaeta sp.]
MNEKIKEQILQVRETGLTNMFNIGAVQWIAEQMGLPELAAYLSEDNTREYSHFILTGEG